MIVEESGLEEGLALEEEGRQGQKRNEDVLSPNTRKTADRRRVIGHEFGDVDALRPPNRGKRVSVSSSRSSNRLERSLSSDPL